MYEIWKGEFDGMHELDEGCIYVLGMHPQLIVKASRIKMLERLIQHMRRFPDVWIAKPIELVREAQKALG